MNCIKCSKKTDLLLWNDQPICAKCAEKNGYSVCLETGKYKNFVCNNVCSDCRENEGDKK